MIKSFFLLAMIAAFLTKQGNSQDTLSINHHFQETVKRETVKAGSQDTLLERCVVMEYGLIQKIDSLLIFHNGAERMLSKKELSMFLEKDKVTLDIGKASANDDYTLVVFGLATSMKDIGPHPDIPGKIVRHPVQIASKEAVNPMEEGSNPGKK